MTDESRERGVALIEQVIDQLSSISARAMSGSEPDDPSELYTACGEMQVTLQEAISLLQSDPGGVTAVPPSGRSSSNG